MPVGTVETLLMELIDLQRSQIHSRSDKEDEDKNDWKLAAAVFDRILFIIFSVLLVGGTIIFAMIVACVYFSNT